MGPRQVYRSADGRRLLLYVRRETRKGVEGYLLVGTDKGVVLTSFVPVDEAVPGELVNDTAGRGEAVLAGIDRDRAELERDALKAAMRQAVSWLSPTQAEDLRKLYVKQLGGG